MTLVRTLTTLALGGLLAAGCAAKDAENAAEKATGEAAKAAEKAPEAPAAPELGPPPKDAKVFFVWPLDGSKVPTTFDVVFGAAGMTVVPAGEAIEDRTKGHHHIIVDGKPLKMGTVVPMDEKNIHYGKGQTQAELTLTPGKHTLTMQFADGAHRSYGDQLSQTIEVEVVELPAKPAVKWIEPADGAQVKSPVQMKFGLEGLGIRPAMEDPKDKTTGHHHVVVNGKPVPLGQVVPADETHIHYGKGQTEATLELKPGKYSLTLQLADGSHLSYGEKLSQTINVEVVE